MLRKPSNEKKVPGLWPLVLEFLGSTEPYVHNFFLFAESWKCMGCFSVAGHTVALVNYCVAKIMKNALTNDWAGFWYNDCVDKMIVLYSALRGFSPSTPDFPSPQKPTFPNSNSILVNARTFLNKFLWTPWYSVGKEITFIFTFTSIFALRQLIKRGYNAYYNLTAGNCFEPLLRYLTAG